MIPTINNPNKDAPFSPILDQEYPENDNEINKIFDDFIAEYSLPETPKRKYDFNDETDQESLNPFKVQKETQNEEEFPLDLIEIDSDLLPHLNIPQSEMDPQVNPEQPNGTKSTLVDLTEQTLSENPSNPLSFANLLGKPGSFSNYSDKHYSNIFLPLRLGSENFFSATTRTRHFDELYSSPLISFPQICYLISVVLEKVIIKLKSAENKIAQKIRPFFNLHELDDILPDNCLFHIDSSGKLIPLKLPKNTPSNTTLNLRSLDLSLLDEKSVFQFNTKTSILSFFRLIIKELFMHEHLNEFKKTEVFKELVLAISKTTDRNKNWYTNLIRAFIDLQNALKNPPVNLESTADAAQPMTLEPTADVIPEVHQILD